jgi:putative toxin-antitoxin system antitoxin component (TIGR02293 family)
MTTLSASKKPGGRRTRGTSAKPAGESSAKRGTPASAQANGHPVQATEPAANTWYGGAKARRAEGHLRLVELYRADPMDRVELVKTGVPAAGFVALASNLHMPKERLAITLGLARATVDRKIRDNKLLSPDESSRVLGMASLVGQVQSLVAESGQVDGFDAGAWVSSWLEQPVPALGGRRPAELMDTSEGQAVVSRLVAQMQSGAYA